MTRYSTSDDFKSWWVEQEFIGGEGCMDAAELAWDFLQSRIATLEAEKAELEKQEPVAQVLVWNAGGSGEHKELQELKPIKHGQMLYTKPQPPAVPDGWLVDGGLAYILKDGVNHYEVNVSMANGSRTREAKHEFAKKIVALLSTAATGGG